VPSRVFRGHFFASHAEFTIRHFLFDIRYSFPAQQEPLNINNACLPNPSQATDADLGQAV
jgi:hypothetical protein